MYWRDEVKEFVDWGFFLVLTTYTMGGLVAEKNLSN